MAKANLKQFVDFRKEKIELLNVGKIDPEDFHDYIYGFLMRTKIKPVMKPKNRQQALQSYYYWTSFIERKIVIEQKLSHYNVGSIELLKHAVKIFIKRREKILDYIFNDLKEKPTLVEIISPKSVKITLKDGHELHASTEQVKDLNLPNPSIYKLSYKNYCRLFITFLENL